MTHRSYSVVVVPDEWDDSLEELAAAMRPVTRREPKQVLPLLARGPMTLEADLSVDEAGLLQARLNKLCVPARVHDSAGETVSGSAHQRATKSAVVPKKKPKAPKDSKALNEKKSADNQWSGLFPDMDSDQAGGDATPEAGASKLNIPEPKAPETKPQSSKKVPSLDELAGDSEASFGAEAAPEAEPTSSKPVSPTEPVSPNEPNQKPPNTPPKQPASPGPPGSQKPRSGDSGALSGGFDAGRMNDALHADDGRKPPYAPEGFDDSLEHIPALAGLLSLIAPGAGQVYNGQKEEARNHGVRAVLVIPWYQSVRQASEYAEKIRTYWAPRPPSGALKDALKYLAVFWLIFGSLTAALGWAGTAVYDVASEPRAPKITDVDIRDAFEQSRTRVHMARINGLDGVAAHVDQRDSQHERFTMSDGERAERLFRRGVDFCRDGKYATCESAMKRVSSLSPDLRRDAYRLQAWASVQKQGGDGDPMPAVGNFDSIEEYERRQQAGKSAEPPAGEGDQSDQSDQSDDEQHRTEEGSKEQP